jgi:hypothetical protein
MKSLITTALFSTALALIPGHASAAQILSNGGFDAGLTGWTKSDTTGSDGTFSLQTGTVSPLSGTAVPAPPSAPNSAMTDAQGPGTHVLYQDFAVTGPVGSAVLTFSLFLGNQAGAYYVPSPATFDFGVAAFNQQARVDVLLSSAGAFSLSSNDVLLNVFQTPSGSATLPSGYANYSFQIASVLNANVNRTLRLRFAEVDNVAPFQLGVDNVSLETSAVPEPVSFVTAGLGVFGVLVLWKCRDRKLRRS